MIMEPFIRFISAKIDESRWKIFFALISSKLTCKTMIDTSALEIIFSEISSVRKFDISLPHPPFKSSVHSFMLNDDIITVSDLSVCKLIVNKEEARFYTLNCGNYKNFNFLHCQPEPQIGMVFILASSLSDPSPIDYIHGFNLQDFYQSTSNQLMPVVTLPLEALYVKCDTKDDGFHYFPFIDNIILTSRFDVASNSLHIITRTSSFPLKDSSHNTDSCCIWADFSIINREKNIKKLGSQTLYLRIDLPTKKHSSLPGSIILSSIIILPDYISNNMISKYQIFIFESQILLFSLSCETLHISRVTIDNEIELVVSSPTPQSLELIQSPPLEYQEVVEVDSCLLLNTAYQDKQSNCFLISQFLFDTNNELPTSNNSCGVPIIFTRLPLPNLSPQPLNSIKFLDDLSIVLFFENSILFIEFHKSFKKQLSCLFEIISNYQCFKDLADVNSNEIFLQAINLALLWRKKNNSLTDSGIDYSMSNISIYPRRESLSLKSSISKTKLLREYSSQDCVTNLNLGFCASPLLNSIRRHQSTPGSLPVLSPNPTLNYSQENSIPRVRIIQSGQFGNFGMSKFELREPNGIVVLPDGTLVISDGNGQSIKFFTTSGQYLNSWPVFSNYGSRGFPNCLALRLPEKKVESYSRLCFYRDVSLKIDSDWGLVVVLRRPTPSIQLYTLSGQKFREFGTELVSPKAVTVSQQDGNVIVVESHIMRVSIFSWYGQLVSRFISQDLSFPTGVACDSNGAIYITDNLKHSVLIYDINGFYLGYFGGDGITSYPTGICITKMASSTPNTPLEEFIVVVDNHMNLNITIFRCNGTLVAALQSSIRHIHLYAMTVDNFSVTQFTGSQLSNHVTNNSLIFTSKDCHVFRYSLPLKF